MYNLRKTEKHLYKRIFRKTRAVSPVVATLILIIVAIVGAIGVGLIVSRVSTSTASQANVGGAQTGSQSTLTIGGSTTIYPVTGLALSAFEQQYGVQVTNSEGGSGAGMQGVIDGVLDIGAASSLSAVYSAVTYVSANSISGVNLQAVQIGGSGVAIITSSTTNGLSIATGNGLTPNFLTDADGDLCVEISAAALVNMYTYGAFNITPATACATGILPAADVVASSGAATCAATVCAGPYQAVGRSDNSGTSDTFTGFINAFSSQYPPGASVGFNGNPGVLAAVQTAKTTAGTVMTATTTSGTVQVAGVIGYVDLGFAEGAVAGLSCGTGWVASSPCNVSIIEPTSNTATPDAIATPSATAGNEFVNDVATNECVYTGTGTAQPTYFTDGTCAAANTGNTLATTVLPAHGNTAGVHAAILAALKLFSNANPYMNNGYSVSYPDTSAPSTGLVKVFYLVTNGTPTPVEQDWINFMTNPNAQTYFNQNGFFAWDQYAAA